MIKVSKQDESRLVRVGLIPLNYKPQPALAPLPKARAEPHTGMYDHAMQKHSMFKIIKVFHFCFTAKLSNGVAHKNRDRMFFQLALTEMDTDS